MPPPATESENYKLLFAIVEQLDVKNINWAKVAESLGIEKVNMVQKRWSVLKKRGGLGQGTANPTKNDATKDTRSKSGGVVAKEGTAKPCPKKRGANATRGTTYAERASKISKTQWEKESDEVEDEAYDPVMKPRIVASKLGVELRELGA
jgi:hypothetical protein